MKSHLELSNPKMDAEDKSDSWYGYYAGYSPNFVRDVLTFLELPKDSLILDPWNGSGTTTQVAASLGYNFVGFDLNPVMVIVSKAKLTMSESQSRLRSMHQDFEKKFNALVLSKNVEVQNDPLEVWFKPDSVRLIRCAEQAIMAVSQPRLIESRKNRSWYSRINPTTAFFYVAIFKCIRSWLASCGCTNPTWIKEPAPKDRAKISKMALLNDLESTIMVMLEQTDAAISKSRNINGEIRLGSSLELPSASAQFDAIISSPPYCTRIDYAVATKPELALLGIEGKALTRLRRSLIGSPTINGAAIEIQNEWGPTCADFLRKVAAHHARASKTYYYKNHAQYFQGIHFSLKELDRLLIKNGYCCLVVQDSYYKDVHNDLPTMFIEMTKLIGWKLLWRLDFENKRSIRQINGATKKYGKNALPIETAMLFQKS